MSPERKTLDFSELAKRARQHAEYGRIPVDIVHLLTDCATALESVLPPVDELVERKLQHAFRNVDDKDWDHLWRFIPMSGHGQFWTTVLNEVRNALSNAKGGK